MSFFALPNLVSKSVEPCVPWEWNSPAPAEVQGKEHKKARDAWITNPATKHQVYSAFEGYLSNARIEDPRGAEEGNPPLHLHAFVADIDTPVSDEELASGIARIGDMVPNYFERTLSGNVRLIWLFEKPVSFPNLRFAVEFMKLALDRTGVKAIAPGLDQPAWCTPNRYYTNSGQWLGIDPAARVSSSLLQGWVVEVAAKHLWKKDRGSVDIPMPVVAAELEKRYPRFKDEWTMEFVEAAQGPTFWIDGSVSPKSAIVKPTGIFTFSSSATKPFYSWAELLGKNFVEKYQAEAMGKAVDGIYHDGNCYHLQDGYKHWRAFSKEDVAQHLATSRGLSSVKDGGLPSEVNRAIEHIRMWNAIDGAAPFAFSPPGILVKNGSKYLNTHTRRVLAPANEPGIWGPHGNFPFISRFLDGLFHKDSVPAHPKDYFISWLHRHYRGCYLLEPESGQIGLSFGVQNIGKTFLSQGLLSYLFGGSAECEDFLMGRSNFNAELFKVGLWLIDDNSVAGDNTTHRKWSVMSKKFAANTAFQYHEKFRTPSPVDWLGRVFITANADEESMRIVPDMTISSSDKYMLWLMQDSGVVFPGRAACRQIIQQEAPYFARFLLDYQIPEHCLSDSSRYGVACYHEKSLLQLADHSSRTATFAEMLEDWRERYFSDNPGAEFWRGTAYGLQRELARDEVTRDTGLRGMTSITIGSNLATLKAKGSPGLACESTTSGRIWTIRPVKVREARIPLPLGNANFAKLAP